MRHYETTYILRPNLGEEQLSEIIARTNEILTSAGGTIMNCDRWGRRTLAYEIKKESQGYYVHVNYGTMPEAVHEMERIFRIDDQVIRYLTIKLDDAFDPEALKAAAEAAAAEEAAAEEAAAQAAAAAEAGTVAAGTAAAEAGTAAAEAGTAAAEAGTAAATETTTAETAE